jgi:hypothetical protein
MSGVAEELARLAGNLGNLNGARTARERLEALAARLSCEGRALGREELRAIEAGAAVLARTIFEVNRAVSIRIRELGAGAGNAGQS